MCYYTWRYAIHRCLGSSRFARWRAWNDNLPVVKQSCARCSPGKCCCWRRSVDVWFSDVEIALLGKDRGINGVAKERRREIVAEERIFRKGSSRSLFTRILAYIKQRALSSTARDSFRFNKSLITVERESNVVYPSGSRTENKSPPDVNKPRTSRSTQIARAPNSSFEVRLPRESLCFSLPKISSTFCHGGDRDKPRLCALQSRASCPADSTSNLRRQLWKMFS